MNFRCRRFTLAIPILLLGIGGVYNLLAFAQGVKNSDPPLVEEDQEQILSYWTAQGGWHSELQLRNNLPAQNLTVTPVLRGPDGTETPLSAVSIKPQEVRSINLNTVLSSFAPQLIGSYGSIALRYRAYDNRNLYAAIMVHDTGHPIAFHIDASAESRAYDAGSREGIWWLPNDATKDMLILTNQGKRSLDLVLSIYDAAGKEVRQQLSLSPRQTGIYSVREYVNSGHLKGSYGGIRVQALDHGGSLDTLHVVYDETAGFSALIKMFDHDPAAKIESRDFARTSIWTQRAPMLALSTPDAALNFPSGTILQPQLFIRNAANKRVTAKLRFVWRRGDASGKSPGPTLVFSANETKRIDVGALQSNGTLPADAHWASAILTSDGPPDELFAVSASYDASLRYGAQTPFSDQLASKWMGGQWEVDAMHDSIITAGNGGTKPTQADFTVFYNQGQNEYEVEQTLQPDEQMWIDVAKLIRDQVPDKKGRVLPQNLASGSYRFRDLTHPSVGLLFEGKVIYDKSYGHVSYGCAACCAERGAHVIYNPFSTILGLGYTNGVEATDTCGGIDDLSGDFYNWDTLNHVVATTTKSGTHTGMSIGSTTSSTSGYVTTTNGRNGCYQVPAAPSGPTNVVATPTNFRVNSESADASGNLNWIYYWDSSTGVDSDLSACTVREYVTYPGSGGFNWASPPYDKSGNPTDNPTIGTTPGKQAAIGDHQLHPGFLKPYVPNTFTATQIFQYSCTNIQNGAWVTFSPTYSIVRTVGQSGSTWTYTVTKDGKNGSMQLP